MNTIIDFVNVQDKIALVKAELLSKFPNSPYTIMINLWDDGDFDITAQYGDTENIHKFYWYSQEPLVKYVIEPMVSNSIKVDAKGNKYYVPNELIQYLSPKTKENLQSA